jgi:hypothetical protein
MQSTFQIHDDEEEEVYINDSIEIEYSKRIKRHYTLEENKFIIECNNQLNTDNKRAKWKEIAKIFNEKFPEIEPKRTHKELLDHFEHSLDKSIKRGKISIEEQVMIVRYVNEIGKQWKTIAKLLNRNENQIKNEFYRKINGKRKEKQKDLNWFDDILFLDKMFEEKQFFFDEY